MKWTSDWLNEHLDTKLSSEEIGDKLTAIGLEMEEISYSPTPIVAKIMECDDIPDTHLHALKVDDGSGVFRDVVCGAPNARVGLISALALPGCRIQGNEIKSGKIRGYTSNGMMCSEKELGISDDHNGIVELKSDSKIGSRITNHEPRTTIFDAGITPNRPDYLSVRGIARDLEAAGCGKIRDRITNHESRITNHESRKAIIKNFDACPVYRFLEIKNIKMAPSSEKIATRLGSIGVNPKNACIDATNYVCYDIGQPMHCFDADEIHGDIIIRNATAGEEFTDLFGANHILQESDLVIADDKGILALAGVVGGARGMTKDTTENIILESAYFSPIGIRKTRRRLGLSTDASYRYERGIDPTVTGEAIDMAAGLIMTECGGEIANSQQQKAQSSKPTAIDYSFDLFKKKTGIELSKEKQIKILERLGYHVTCHMSHVTLTPPAYRIDIEIPENIVSDLIRIYGYENIPAYVQPVLRADMRPLTALKEQLAARGLSEHISMGFGSSAAEMAVYGETGVRIANPIADFLDVARFGLIPNMLQAIADNERRGYADLAMFEYGTTFWGDAPGEQQKQLLIARTGSAVPRHWTHRTRKADIYDVKADLIALDVGARGNAPGSDWTIETNNPPKWAHPYRYGRMVRDGKTIAEFGELHPSVAKYFKIKTNVVLAIVYESQVTNHEPRTTNHDLQPIHRDFAFEVDADFPAGKIVSLAVSVDKRIIDIIVFDAFDLGSGKKSIGFTITIQPEANMSDTDILEIQNAVIEAVEKNTPARIRDGQ